MGSCAGVWPYSENAIFVYTGAWVIQKVHVYSTDNKGRVCKNYKFHDTRGRGAYARAWPYKSYCEYVYYLLLYQYTTS